MLLLPIVDYYEPEDLPSACALLDELRSDGKIIAGGTDLLVKMKEKKIAPRALISMARIAALSEIEQHGEDISIGSRLIVAKLVESDVIRKRFAIVAKAASVLGSPLIRNRATIGGNLVTARPAADLIPPLIALSARVELRSAGGNREVAVADLCLGPGQTVIKPEEVLTNILIREVPKCSGGDYLKLGHRNALEIAIVGVACRIDLEEPGGRIKDSRIVLSAVAPKATHATAAEKVLQGEKPTEKLFEEAGLLASKACAPISDLRGGAEYRREMVRVLTKRTLLGALKEAHSYHCS